MYSLTSTRLLPKALLVCSLLTLFGALTACSDDSSSPSNPANTSSQTSDTSTPDVGSDTGGDDVEEDTTPPPTPESFAQAVDADRYEASLRFVAQERPQGSTHWQAVQDRCAEVFEASGFTVERHQYGSGVNVIGVKPGTTRETEYVVLSAHYDEVPACVGAGRNASGVAGVLEAARILGADEQRFEHTLVVACWDQNTVKHTGARAWVKRAKRQGHAVRASYVFESIAYTNDEANSQSFPLGFSGLFPESSAAVDARNNAGDFIAVVGDDLQPSAREDFLTQAEAIGLPSIPIVLNASLRSNSALDGLRNSDHNPFWAEDLPSIMLTDTVNLRNPNAFCFRGEDSVDTLNLPFAVQVTRAAVGAAAQQAIPTNNGQPATLDTTTDPSPPTPPCNPATQEGCSEEERCVQSFDEDDYTFTQCIARASQPASLDASCEVVDGFGNDTCEKGAGCVFWGLPQSNPQARLCQPYCDPQNPCDAGENCLRINKASQNVGLCIPSCDPMAGLDECPDGTLCLKFENADPARNAFMCLRGTPGDREIGDTCTLNGQCKSGSFCLPGAENGVNTCALYCKTDDDCADGTTCTATEINQEGVGYCIGD